MASANAESGSTAFTNRVLRPEISTQAIAPSSSQTGGSTQSPPWTNQATVPVSSSVVVSADNLHQDTIP